MTGLRKADRATAAGSLLPQHADMIAASGVSPEVAQARGYRSMTVAREVRALGFSDRQARVPALLLPIWGVTGVIETYQLRPDAPRIVDGKALKYETPKGSRVALDVPPSCRPMLGDSRVPLFITEGVRKADAAASQNLCCMGLLGVWNWRGTNDLGGKTALPDWEHVALDGRDVFIVFDSDVVTKRAVYSALCRLKAFLESRKASVRVIYLPPGPGGTKVGLDDYLVAGNSVADLLACANTQLRPRPDDAGEEPGPYCETPAGLVWRRPTREGVVQTALTNFGAKIVAEIVEDDGTDETRCHFEIVATLQGREHRISVPASRFGAMNWVTELLGAEAVLPAGFGLRDHARAAIQSLSNNITKRSVYTHTGWRKITDQWVYLHAGGAIGSTGGVGIATRLPGVLTGYALEAATTPGELLAGVRTSLALVARTSDAPAEIMIPLYAAIWRAVLGRVAFSLHLVGPTGVFKSELAALGQQHWGAGLDARHLPGTWSSTANALEGMAFHIKDAVFVVDDFAPQGSVHDSERLHREADRLFRAQGNQAGRHRMRADTSLRPDRPPRGLIVSTGEDTPRGQSLRARVLVLEVAPGAIKPAWLTARQRDAADGRYAQALAGYVAWLAPQYDTVWATWATRFPLVRDTAPPSCAHRRVAEIFADLALGLGWFLAFAYDIAALTLDEIESLWVRAWDALAYAAAAQGDQQQEHEPTRRFLDLLRAALVNGDAHLADKDGGSPGSAGSFGWRETSPSGSRIGWIDGDNIYLEPEAAYAAVQRLARTGGNAFGVTLSTLKRRLHEQGLLQSIDARGGKKRFEIRHVCEGERRGVLHLHVGALYPPDEVAQVAHGLENSCGIKAIPWATLWATGRSGVAHDGRKPQASPDGPATVGEHARETNDVGPLGGEL